MSEIHKCPTCNAPCITSGNVTRFFVNYDVALTAFLRDRERDIAVGLEDFGDLRGAFIAVFRREPK